jgi:hypothetical protein
LYANVFSRDAGLILGIFYPIFIKFVGLAVMVISVTGVVLGILGIQTLITMSPFVGFCLIAFVLLTWLISFVYFIRTL